MSTEIPVNTSPTNVAQVPEVQTPVIAEPNSENNLYTYIFVGVLVAVLLLLLYYAYGRFVSNSKKKCKKNADDNADDEVLDFNLREAIRELQQIQIRVMGTLSEQSDI
jgi:hypothetical protein